MVYNREPTPTRDTALERKLHSTLSDMGFDVEDSVPLDRWELDCYVRELHLGFEADGPTHSGHRQVRDTQRDEAVRETFGVEVLRISQRTLQGPESDLIAALDSFIEEHAETSEERRVISRGLM